MKVFCCDEIHEALEYARGGGITIHLHRIVFPDSPSCFKRDVEDGLPIAHVLGQDKVKLTVLASKMGVRKVFVDKAGTPRQHVDLCGAPLRRLLAEVGDNIENYRLVTKVTYEC